MRFLLLTPLVVSLSVARAAAIPIDYSSLAELEASGIGPRIAHRTQSVLAGRYEDGSVASGVTSHLPQWFSSVYFDGTLYTYAYGVSELICGNCDENYQFRGEASLVGGELVGATLGDRYGGIIGFTPEGFLVGFSPVTQTAQGFTFVGGELAWFYLQSARAPADMFGRLIATSRISGGNVEEGQPRHLVYTMGMDAFVPVPEPGTLVLVTTGLAGALIRRRSQKQKGTIT